MSAFTDKISNKRDKIKLYKTHIGQYKIVSTKEQQSHNNNKTPYDLLLKGGNYNKSNFTPK